MANHKITHDVDRSFELLGIATSIRDYKLCDTTVAGKDRATPSTFPVFSAYQEVSDETFLLFVNKTSSGILLPEAASFDYLLKIVGTRTDSHKLHVSLKDDKDILTTAPIAVKTLKLPERLIYEVVNTDALSRFGKKRKG
jgi:hypothetical protein